MRYEVWTVEHESPDQKESLIKRDRVKKLSREARGYQIKGHNGVARDTGAESNWRSHSLYTGRLFPVVESWDVGSGLETKQECNNILAIRHPVTTVDSWDTDDGNETKEECNILDIPTIDPESDYLIKKIMEKEHTELVMLVGRTDLLSPSI